MAAVAATYSSIFVFSIKCYEKLYSSQFFYIGIVLIACSSILCTKYIIGAKGSGHDLGEEFFDEFDNPSTQGNKATIKKYFSEIWQKWQAPFSPP